MNKMNNMQTTTSNNQVIYIFGNNEPSYPLSQRYLTATQLYKSNNISGSVTVPCDNNEHQLYPLHQLYSNNRSGSVAVKYDNNEHQLYPLHQLYSNNRSGSVAVKYDNNEHQLYPNNRSSTGSDPFIWFFPDPDQLLDQYVPHLLQLYSQESDKIKTEQEVMNFFNNDDSLNNIIK
jgi:hypothetical protein